MRRDRSILLAFCELIITAIGCQGVRVLSGELNFFQHCALVMAIIRSVFLRRKLFLSDVLSAYFNSTLFKHYYY